MDAPPPRLDSQRIKDMLWAFACGSSEYAILLLRASGTIAWANRGAAHILGAAQEHLLQQDIARFFTARDVSIGVPGHELEVAVQSGTASDDRWMLRADQSRFWASGATVHLGQDPDCSFIKVFRDQTEGKMQLESMRERAQASAATVEQATVAIGVLAHELRNPLAGIILTAELMGRHHRQPGADGFDRDVNAILDNATLAARLVDDLMQHSKLSSTGLSLERAPCQLREVLEASVAIARMQMGQEDRPIAVLVPAGDVPLHIDRMRMQQVLVNLVANALRYTPPPGRIWVTGTVEACEAVIRVSDEGVGIEPDRLDRLFDLFTLPHLRGSKLGLGVGLSLVKKIVDLHGGSVQARSEGPGKGSQFVVRFPVRG